MNLLQRVNRLCKLEITVGLDCYLKARQIGLLGFLNAYFGKKHNDDVFVEKILKASMLGHEFRNVRAFLKVFYDTLYRRLFYSLIRLTQYNLQH